ncbi:MAG: hypothetical protein GY807_10230 [Gammaproteobacteria bacterium]|nr:hypothetical protein [Gammaproteobacteria bacterium]
MLAVWLPVIVFAGLGLVVYLWGDGSLETEWQHWRSLQLDEKIVLAVVFLAPVTMIAFVIHYLQVPITRLFEGYWEKWPGLRAVGHKKRAQYQTQVNALDERSAELSLKIPVLKQKGQSVEQQKAELKRVVQYRMVNFPPPDDEQDILPTRLGNIYRAAELYPYHRYGLDSVAIWPRLRQVLPDDFMVRMQELKIAVDFLLLFSLLAVLFSLLAVPYLLWQRAELWMILTCAAGLPLGWLTYRAALTPALAYAELIKVAYDLYRRTLLKTLDLNLPATLDEERKLWEDLSQFIIRKVVPKVEEQWQYVTKAEDAKG